MHCRAIVILSFCTKTKAYLEQNVMQCKSCFYHSGFFLADPNAVTSILRTNKTRMYISNDFTRQPRPSLESSNPSPMASRCLQSDLTNGVAGPCISKPKANWLITLLSQTITFRDTWSIYRPYSHFTFHICEVGVTSVSTTY